VNMTSDIMMQTNDVCYVANMHRQVIAIIIINSIEITE
jgi:hypothetical protein